MTAGFGKLSTGLTNPIIKMFALLKETYRLLKKHSGTYFVIFVLEIVLFSATLLVSAAIVEFPEIRNSVENRFNAKIFFTENVTPDKINRLISNVKRRKNIETELIKPSEAARIFAERMNMKTSELIKEIKFPYSLTLRFGHDYSFSEISEFLNELKNNNRDIVQSVKYPKKTAYFISKHFFLISLALLALFIILIWGTVIILKQFFRKIIEMSSEENKIKSLIGVKPSLIKLPFSLAGGLITTIAFFSVSGIYAGVIFVTQNNILLEKRLLFPIIITLILSVFIKYRLTPSKEWGY